MKPALFDSLSYLYILNQNRGHVKEWEVTNGEDQSEPVSYHCREQSFKSTTTHLRRLNLELPANFDKIRTVRGGFFSNFRLATK